MKFVANVVVINFVIHWHCWEKGGCYTDIIFIVIIIFDDDDDEDDDDCGTVPDKDF